MLVIWSLTLGHLDVHGTSACGVAVPSYMCSQLATSHQNVAPGQATDPQCRLGLLGENPVVVTRPDDPAPFDFTTGLAWGRPRRLLFRGRQRGASPPFIRVRVDSSGFTCEPAFRMLRPFEWLGWIPGHLRVEWRDVDRYERLNARVLQIVPKGRDALQVGWARPNSLDRMAAMAEAAVGHPT
jgi:hypothetical protein